MPALGHGHRLATGTAPQPGARADAAFGVANIAVRRGPVVMFAAFHSATGASRARLPEGCQPVERKALAVGAKPVVKPASKKQEPNAVYLLG
jgi:hypothetical protein